MFANCTASQPQILMQDVIPATLLNRSRACFVSQGPQLKHNIPGGFQPLGLPIQWHLRQLPVCRTIFVVRQAPPTGTTHLPASPRPLSGHVRVGEINSCTFNWVLIELPWNIPEGPASQASNRLALQGAPSQSHSLGVQEPRPGATQPPQTGTTHWPASRYTE
jgi:hypothetical protein